MTGPHGRSNLPSYDDHLLLALGRAVKLDRSPIGLDGGFISFDEDRSVFLQDFELGEGIEGRGIFDITRRNVEAGSAGHSASVPFKSISMNFTLTAMPWTGQSSVGGHYPILQRRSIMGAIGTHRMGLVPHLDQKNLSVFHPVHFHLAFLPILQITLGKTFDLVFCRHGFDRLAPRGDVIPRELDGSAESKTDGGGSEERD